MDTRHLPAAAFGMLMVAAAGSQVSGPALVVSAVAAAAVVTALRFRHAATAAVLLAAATLVLGDAPLMFAGLTGLAATAYLVLRHAVGGVATATAPTMIASSAFTAVAVLAAAIPVTVPWLPLAAPPAVLAGYLLAVRPYFAAREP